MFVYNRIFFVRIAYSRIYNEHIGEILTYVLVNECVGKCIKIRTGVLLLLYLFLSAPGKFTLFTTAISRQSRLKTPESKRAHTKMDEKSRFYNGPGEEAYDQMKH